jgi:hypothetical protein
LGLNHPVFLLSSDTFNDGKIFLKDGFVFFEGKTILLRRNLTAFNKTRLPDFIINPVNTENYEHSENPQTTIISNKRFMNKNELETVGIHFLTLQGAFRKKW